MKPAIFAGAFMRKDGFISSAVLSVSHLGRCGQQRIPLAIVNVSSHSARQSAILSMTIRLDDADERIDAP